MITDELLKLIAEGSGRTYNYEGKAMAQELMKYRAQAREAAAKAAQAANAPATGQPFPFGLYP